MSVNPFVALVTNISDAPGIDVCTIVPKGAYQEMLSLGSVSGNTILVSQEVLSL